MIAGTRSETPKPADPAFQGVASRIIASNAKALDGAAAEATRLGYLVERVGSPIEGEASSQGVALVRRVIDDAPADRRSAVLAGGETTVLLGPNSGLGGRCQTLALAAARELATHPPARPAVLLAGGTDGRDGPTDAAGALIDASTWSLIASRGIDPELALRRHNAFPALDAAGALIRIGLTGTNVMDVVIGLVG